VWVPLDGGVLALDSATGAVKREVKLGEPRHGDTRTTGPVIGKTHLFVPAAGKIWAVDRQTGAATELATGKGPLALAGGRLYFLALDNPDSMQVHLAALESVTK
jgi:hypothetical protein